MTTQITWKTTRNNRQETEIEGRIFIAEKRQQNNGRGNAKTSYWIIYRNDAQRPLADSFVKENDLRTAKAKFAEMVEVQLAEKRAKETAPALIEGATYVVTYKSDFMNEPKTENLVLVEAWNGGYFLNYFSPRYTGSIFLACAEILSIEPCRALVVVPALTA